MEILKFVCLVFGIWFTYVNTINGLKGRTVRWQSTLAMSIADAGFIYLQWLK